MFGIGDFARHGRVSVRMLRHYDATGLLRPARVDGATGYRFYTAAQLARLNRILALKDLGFTLDQVRSILDEEVTVAELRGMLRLRHADLQERIAADADRLARVEERLRSIESEECMSAHDIIVKQVPAVRVAQLSATAAGYRPEDIGPVVSPLFGDLFTRLEQAGIAPAGSTIAHYEDDPGTEGGIRVHAAVPVTDPAAAAEAGLEVVDLPEIPEAATVVHRGPMDGVLPVAQALARWIEAQGYRSLGYAREFYLEYGCGDPEGWATELQEPVAAAEKAGS